MGTSKLPILIVGSQARNLELLGEFLQKEGYKTLSAATLEQFGKLLDSEEHFGLALVEVAGFDRSIWTYCERCFDQKVPFLVISPPQVASIRQESMSHGAHGVLFKPLVLKELVALVRGMMRGSSDD